MDKFGRLLLFLLGGSGRNACAPGLWGAWIPAAADHRLANPVAQSWPRCTPRRWHDGVRTKVHA